MLNPDLALKILERALDDMITVYPSLDAWKVDMRVTALDRFVTGTCTRDIDYLQAEIKLNPSTFETPAEAYESAIHECFHIVCAPFDRFTDYAREKGAYSESVRNAALEPVIVTLARGFIRAHGNPFKEEVTQI